MEGEDKLNVSRDSIGPDSNEPYFREAGFCSKLYYRCCRKKQHALSYRVLKRDNKLYPPISNDNTIKNTKYNIITFFPLFFFNQFKYFFNFYYLCLCLSQFYPPLKIGFLFTYIGPLAFVLFLSMFNVIVDELVKFIRDFEVNSEKFTVIENGVEKTKRSGNLEVGDVVYLKEGQRAPADLLIISTSEKDDRVYVRTDQIDGETDAKLRKATPVLSERLRQGKDLWAEDIEFVVPPPNDLIYKFEGTVHLLENGIIKMRIPVDYDNTLWGGCKIVKGSVTGLVLYNGKDSKIMMSSFEGEIKRSLVNDELNDYSKILFLIMLILSLAVMYLRGTTKNFFIQLFRYVLLLSTIIPISMKVNHDISKLYYSSRINNDKDIEGCQARNSNVCEDLGRIQYFLTDKTGTLTKNIMVMRKLFIQNVGLINEPDFKKSISTYSKSQSSKNFNDFIMCMMVCHSVSPTKDKDGKRVLESASPDEISFIEMMETNGLKLVDKTDQNVEYKDALGNTQKWKVLLTFPFTSERKRMGVIAQKEGDQNYTFFLKGADSIIKPKIAANYREVMMNQAEQLSSQGLRTLALCKTQISLKDYEAWKKDYDTASASLKRRNEKVEASIELLEKDMEWIGITAVEDLLQDNVKASIVLLREAGIKVWMLTGDKMETAKCISLSTGLYSKRDEIWLVDRITNGAELKAKFTSFLETFDRSKVIIYSPRATIC